MKMNNFRGDLSDISAKNEALYSTDVPAETIPLVRLQYIFFTYILIIYVYT